MSIFNEIRKRESIIPLLLDESYESPPESITINGQKVEALSKSVFKITPEVINKEECFLYSCGIHGNETAPIEIVSDILLKILNNKLQCHAPTLIIFGNLEAMRAQKRFIDFNLNRLFNKDYEKHLDAIEAKRAQELEEVVFNFREETQPLTLLHLDLHTAIKGSKHKRFAICPVANTQTSEHINIFKAMSLDANIKKTTSSNTFSDFTSNMKNSHSYTLELGKVMPFGGNNHDDFFDSRRTLEDLLSGNECKSKEKELFNYITSQKIVKENDTFRYLVDENDDNFFLIPKNTDIYEQDGQKVRYDKDTYMLFANSSVKHGQWAGILLERLENL